MALISAKFLLGKLLWGRFCAAVLTGTLNGFNAHGYLPESELVFCPNTSLPGVSLQKCAQLTPFWCTPPPQSTCLCTPAPLHLLHTGCGEPETAFWWTTGTLPQQAVGWIGLRHCEAALSSCVLNCTSMETLPFPKRLASSGGPSAPLSSGPNAASAQLCRNKDLLTCLRQECCGWLFQDGVRRELAPL